VCANLKCTKQRKSLGVNGKVRFKAAVPRSYAVKTERWKLDRVRKGDEPRVCESCYRIGGRAADAGHTHSHTRAQHTHATNTRNTHTHARSLHPSCLQRRGNLTRQAPSRRMLSRPEPRRMTIPVLHPVRRNMQALLHVTPLQKRTRHLCRGEPLTSSLHQTRVPFTNAHTYIHTHEHTRIRAPTQRHLSRSAGEPPRSFPHLLSPNWRHDRGRHTSRHTHTDLLKEYSGNSGHS
jgi:hypothetical protein